MADTVTAHNTFAVPILTPTFGILSWTKEELEHIDVKTRKLLTLSGSFHRNGDVDRLYWYRSEGGRGLNSIHDTYTTRIVALGIHIDEMSHKNKYLNLVKIHEVESIMRQSAELQESYDEEFIEVTPRPPSAKIKSKIKKEHLTKWLKKPQHGFLMKTRGTIEDTNHEHSQYWLTKCNLSSHIEGYICAIQEEEINTRGLQQRRSKGNTDDTNRFKCRLCHREIETIQHLLACCERLRIPFYLPVRDNAVAAVLHQFLTKSR